MLSDQHRSLFVCFFSVPEVLSNKSDAFLFTEDNSLCAQDIIRSEQRSEPLDRVCHDESRQTNFLLLRFLQDVFRGGSEGDESSDSGTFGTFSVFVLNPRRGARTLTRRILPD